MALQPRPRAPFDLIFFKNAIAHEPPPPLCSPRHLHSGALQLINATLPFKKKMYACVANEAAVVGRDGTGANA